MLAVAPFGFSRKSIGWNMRFSKFESHVLEDVLIDGFERMGNGVEDCIFVKFWFLVVGVRNL